MKKRFGTQNTDFILRQELYARKQGVTEPLSVYTEDMIKRCQRLALSEIDLMNIFINGLSTDLKNHVILNQPKTFAEAENLARLRDAVLKASGVSSSFAAASQNQFQEKKIKELEGQVNLLMSLASHKKETTQAPLPVNVLTNEITSKNPFATQNAVFSAPQQVFQPESTVSDEIASFKTEVIAALQTFAQAQQCLFGRQYSPSLLLGSSPLPVHVQVTPLFVLSLTLVSRPR